MNPPLCAWCRVNPVADPRARFCCRKCRQSAYRLRRRRTTEVLGDRPMVMAYADPPYPGTARKWYGDQPSYGGEVDHVCAVLPLCPPGARVCAWVKPIGACPATYGLHNTWEPLIVVCGRALRPGKRDWLMAQPARHGGDLPGRKPLAFCAWLFDCLGMLPGDRIVDLYPGTGIVSRAWDELSLGADGVARSSSRRVVDSG
ncbi:MAG: hypothetical protein ACYC6C_13975, partial [Coriobacteriia bacterium]